MLSGEIVTSRLVRASVQRHVNDLARQSSSDFPYHYDAAWAHKVCEFFPNVIKHSIGEFAGLPFVLSPFQQFITASIFGWKRDDDNSRRFRKAFISLARKNGKSTYVAALTLFCAMADIDPKTGRPEAVGQIFIAATKKEQANVIFDEAKRMLAASPALSKYGALRYGRIFFDRSQTYIRTLGTDRPFSGLNPSMVCRDEIHEWREFHRKFHDTMMTGGGSRTQPLDVAITTAGDENSHIYQEEYDYAGGCCTGDIANQSVFGFIAELDKDDDVLDENNWAKANPNLGVSVNLRYLRDQALEAKYSAILRNKFKRYHCNQIVTSFEQAISQSDWDACGEPLSDWREADTITAGFDLGGRDDLAAWALVARFPLDLSRETPVYRWEVITKCYLTTDTERDLTQQPWCNWIAYGFIHASRYPIGQLTRDLIEQCRELGVKDIGYDTYMAQQTKELLEQEGMRCIPVPQSCTGFNEPVRELLSAISGGRFRHGNLSPVLRWCALNAVISRDGNERWKFDKAKSKEKAKIDPIVAVAMALKPCLVAPPRSTGSLYLI